MQRPADTAFRSVSFLEARLVQALLVIISAIVILPVAWSFFFHKISGGWKTKGC